MSSALKVKIFTIFPEIFSQALNVSIIGDALKNNIWNLELINIRDFAKDKRGTVDDTPYGGGAGMVMKPDIIADAIDAHIKDLSQTKFIYPSPRGIPLKQKKVKQLSEEKELAIICGRYEGIDQRVIDEYQMEEISIGDFVLSGGELPAMVLIDAIVRNLPNVLGGDESLKEESFGDGCGSEFDNLLEYPHYTKPQNWRGQEVPEILLSGHHQNIKDWRLKKAQEITAQRRKDLINN
ncbi:MAG: tRNA (guanosine(37)-N1)-methyltransferase TrmD [Proteobacteria bacterium]|nr:tRNA (guanosine(37)-N1)-methyltransferase TrmD [Pseudomonadota bacterium]